MYIPMDVVLVWLGLGLGLLWLACRKEVPPSPPPTERLSPPRQAEPDFSRPPPEVAWLRTFQVIAQARDDWRMSDYYRDEANRLEAQHDTDRLAYNQQLRDRILKG